LCSLLNKQDYELLNGNLRQAERLCSSRSNLAGRRCAYAKPADKNVMHTQKDFDRDVYKNPYLKVAGIRCASGVLEVAPKTCLCFSHTILDQEARPILEREKNVSSIPRRSKPPHIHMSRSP
jgi:hypothetical protein